MTYIESDIDVLKQDGESNNEVLHETERSKMALLGIGFDGRYYRYREYRYDLCSDAVNYAQLDHSRSMYRTPSSAILPWKTPEEPTDDEKKVMSEFGITYDGKYYRYEGYRYDRFADAINYAKLKR